MTVNLQNELIQLEKEIRALKYAYPFLAEELTHSASIDNPLRADGDTQKFNTYKITYQPSDTAILTYAFPPRCAFLESPSNNQQIVRCLARDLLSFDRSHIKKLSICSTRPILKLEQIG